MVICSILVCSCFCFINYTYGLTTLFSYIYICFASTYFRIKYFHSIKQLLVLCLSRRCTYIWFKKTCLRMRHYIAFMVLGSTESQCMIVCPQSEYGCCLWAGATSRDSYSTILSGIGSCVLRLCGGSHLQNPNSIEAWELRATPCVGATSRTSILLYQPFGGASQFTYAFGACLWCS